MGGKIYPLVSRTHWNSPESGSVTLDPVCCCQTMGIEICKSDITGCFIIIKNVHSFQHIQNAEIKFSRLALADFVTATCVYYQTLLQCLSTMWPTVALSFQEWHEETYTLLVELVHVMADKSLAWSKTDKKLQELIEHSTNKTLLLI